MRTPTPLILLPLHIVGALGLMGLVSLLCWTVRHRRGLRHLAAEDGVVPPERGARSNLIFLACVMVVMAISLLLLIAIAA